jgi:peptidyl-prolyl cis-trans isomerase B (cyclophilin B)
VRSSSRNTRTARQLRVRKEARLAFERELRRRRLRDNAFAGLAGTLTLALAIALQVFWFSSNPTVEDLDKLREGARVEQSAPADPSPSQSPEESAAAPGP